MDSKAPATSQRAINHIIQNLEGTSAHLDDLVIKSQSWEEQLVRLLTLLTRQQEAGLTINLAKSSFSKSPVGYLGHVVGNSTVRPKEAILAFPTPTTRKGPHEVPGDGRILQEVLQQLLHCGSPADKPHQRVCPLHLEPGLRTGGPTSKGSSHHHQWFGHLTTHDLSIYKLTLVEWVRGLYYYKLAL